MLRSLSLRNLIRTGINGSFDPRRLFDLTPRQVRGHAGLLGSPAGVFLPQEARNKATKARGGKRRGKVIENEVSDSEDEDLDDLELESGPDFRDVKVNIPSLRLDALLKAGLKTSRSKVDTAFYASKILVNGETPLKKGKLVREADKLDLVKGSSGDVLEVSRVEILRATLEGDPENFKVVLRVYPKLLVPREFEEDY